MKNMGLDLRIPLVSVIVPNFNHAAYLKKRLDSIVEQTFQDFELIILDDCSTDNSIGVIDQFKSHPRVSHVVLNEKNSGSTFKQWKKGFELARGDFVWIAESDDFSDLKFLEKMVQALQADTSLAAAFSQSQIVGLQDESLSYSWDVVTPKNTSKAFSKYDGRAFILERMSGNNSIYNASMTLFQRKLLANVRPDYSKFKYCGDWLFWLEIAQQGAVVEVHEKLNFFRRHPGNVSGNAERNGLTFTEGTEILKYIFSKYEPDFKTRMLITGKWVERFMWSKADDAVRKKCFDLIPGSGLYKSFSFLIYKAKNLVWSRF